MSFFHARIRALDVLYVLPVNNLFTQESMRSARDIFVIPVRIGTWTFWCSLKNVLLFSLSLVMVIQVFPNLQRIADEIWTFSKMSKALCSGRVLFWWIWISELCFRHSLHVISLAVKYLSYGNNCLEGFVLKWRAINKGNAYVFITKLN